MRAPEKQTSMEKCPLFTCLSTGENKERQPVPARNHLIPSHTGSSDRMPPRNTNRRRSKIPTGGKNPGKKTTKAHSPSTTLQEILTSLNLIFDCELGVLNGESTSALPSVPTVENLRKLLVKLSDQLEIVSNHDDSVLAEVQSILTKRENGQPDDEESDEEEAEGTDAMDVDQPSADDTEAPTEVKVKTEDESKIEDEDDETRDVFTDANDKLLDGTPEPAPKRKLSTDRIENDPSVRNPKSEFVTSQTLPAAAQALGLFSEEDGGLNQTGEEYFKKKYAVASYPKTDLKDKLPGEIPDIDFSKSKPSNQVQFATFQSWFENFYRQFSEDDLKFLKNKFIMPESLANDPSYDPNLTPYMIPDLGPLYSDVWNDEENAGNYSPPPQKVTKDAVIPKSSSTELNDDALDNENVSCGPLVSRLLSAILRNDKDDINANGGDDDEDKAASSASVLGDQQSWKVSSVNADYSTLEERLKRELKYIGIFMNLANGSKDDDGDDDAEPDWLNTQDDEVSAELRTLQNELKQVSKRNNKRKKILLPVIEHQLAWQEYNSILDDLEKQVDQAYLKRIRAPKNKKRKTGNAVPPSLQAHMQAQAAQQAAANSGVKSLLEKRQRWIEKIGPLFDRNGDGPESMKKYPKDSIFDKENLDEDEDEEYEDGEDLVLQQQDHD